MVHKGKTKCTNGGQLEWSYLEHKTALCVLERICSLCTVNWHIISMVLISPCSRFIIFPQNQTHRKY